MMPHSLKSAQIPATIGVAIEVPVLVSYPPPGNGPITFSPGATISGLISWVHDTCSPLPLYEDNVFVLPL